MKMIFTRYFDGDLCHISEGPVAHGCDGGQGSVLRFRDQERNRGHYQGQGEAWPHLVSAPFTKTGSSVFAEPRMIVICVVSGLVEIAAAAGTTAAGTSSCFRSAGRATRAGG